MMILGGVLARLACSPNCGLVMERAARVRAIHRMRLADLKMLPCVYMLFSSITRLWPKASLLMITEKLPSPEGFTTHYYM